MSTFTPSDKEIVSDGDGSDTGGSRHGSGRRDRNAYAVLHRDFFDDNQEPSVNMQEISEHMYLLSNEFRIENHENYSSAWSTVLRLVSSTEPSERLIGLQCMQAASENLYRSFISVVEDKRSVALMLCDFTTSDESAINRHLGARVLGSYLSVLKLNCAWIIENGFDILIAKLRDTLPSGSDWIEKFHQFQQNESPQVVAQLNESRQHLIGALGNFIETPPALKKNSIEFLDNVFFEILCDSSGRSLFLQAEVIQVQWKHLRRTRANYLRIQKFYSPIFKLGLQGKNIHQYILQQICRWWSVWYPLTPDDMIMNIADSTITNELMGYCRHRKALLTDTSSTTSENVNIEKKVVSPKRGKRNNKKVEEAVSAEYYLKDVDYIDIVRHPNCKPKIAGSLTFNLGLNGIRFDTDPYIRTFHLTNTNKENSRSFRIQVEPHKFFTATPSFGTVQRLSSIPINIRFLPKAHYEKSSITGYLRIRNQHGLPIERVPLMGWNGPFIEVKQELIDCSFCLLGQERTFDIAVTNVGLIPVNAAAELVCLDTGPKPPFKVTPPHRLIHPSETKMFELTFKARRYGNVQDELHISCMGGEVHRISVDGWGGQPLKVIDSIIDFGATEIDSLFNPTKKLLIKNRDMVNPLPISFSYSSTSLEIDLLRSSTIPPNFVEHVQLSFKPKELGPWSEELIITAPNSKPAKVQLRAFVGEFVFMPMEHDIYLASSLTGCIQTLNIPIVNRLDAKVEFHLLSPAGTPISFKFLHTDNSNQGSASSNHSNSRELGKADLPIDLMGCCAELHPHKSSMVEITFDCSHHGLYRIPLRLDIRKPFNTSYPPYWIHKAVFDTSLCKDVPSLQLRNFYKDPSHMHTSLKIPFDRSPDENVNSIGRFSITPPLLEIYAKSTNRITGSSDLSELQPTFGRLSIRNVSDSRGSYLLVLSSPFVTDMPLEGSLGPGETTQVLIMYQRLTPISPEMCIGAATVLDLDGGIMASSSLRGFQSNVLHLCLDNEDSLNFLRCLVNESYSKKVLIQNCSPRHINWSIDFVNSCDNEKMLKAKPSGPATWTKMEGTLKPWLNDTLVCEMQSAVRGEFEQDFKIVYVHPVTIDAEISNEMFEDDEEEELYSLCEKTQLKLLSCKSIVGFAELCVQPKMLNFFDILVGHKVSKFISITNMSNQTADIVVSLPSRFYTLCRSFSVPSKTEYKLECWFQPNNISPRGGFIMLLHGNDTIQIPVTGTAGTVDIFSNIACSLPFLINQPVRPSLPDHLEFGLTSTALPVTKRFIIYNTGTMPFVMIDIIAEPSNILTWSRAEKDNSYESALEPDYDELQFQLHEKEKLRLNKKSGKNDNTDSEDELFPLMLRPHTPLELDLTFFSDHIGVFSPTLSLWSLKSASQPFEKVVFQTTACAEPFPILNIHHVDFGILSTNLPHTQTIRFSNTGNQPVFWYVPAAVTNCMATVSSSDMNRHSPNTDEETPLQRHKRRLSVAPNQITTGGRNRSRFSISLAQKQNLIDLHKEKIRSVFPLDFPDESDNVVFLEADISPVFEGFPIRGRLDPGNSQSLDITFKPSIPQRSFSAKLPLCTENLGKTYIELSGIGGSPQLVTDVSSLSYGCIRVGTLKSLRFTLTNVGLIAAVFKTILPVSMYSMDLVHGVLEPGASIEMLIQFEPISVGEFPCKLSIQWEGMQFGEDVYIHLLGGGGFPELKVDTKAIDFGTALLGYPNRQPLIIENRGDAEAVVVAHTKCPTISLENIDQSPLDSIMMAEPLSSLQLNIVYFPRAVEQLDTEITLYSADNKHNAFNINLIATVGVPKLVFEPEGVLDYLDMGVCQLGQPFEQSFYISNKGNIDLRFDFSFMEQCLQTAPGAEQIHGTWMCPYSQGYNDSTDEEMEPIFKISPPSGCLFVGKTIQMTLTFCPRVFKEVSECLVVLRNDFQYVIGHVHGVAGMAILDTDEIPMTVIDFGLCRLNARFHHNVSLSNVGNIGLRYQIRPMPDSGDWTAAQKAFDGSMIESSGVKALDSRRLKECGFNIRDADGYVEAHSKKMMRITFTPRGRTAVGTNLRLFYTGSHLDLELRGRAGAPSLKLYNNLNVPFMTNSPETVFDVGICPVNTNSLTIFKLANEGSFPLDFFVQPYAVTEFQVTPQRGRIAAGETAPLRVLFSPTSIQKINMDLRVIWEGDPYELTVMGAGGMGKLTVEYLNDSDIKFGGLDFDKVPTNTASQKIFFIHNHGTVPLHMHADSDSEEFLIAQVGDPRATYEELRATKKHETDGARLRCIPFEVPHRLLPAIDIVVPEKHFVEIRCSFCTPNSSATIGSITLSSEFNNVIVPMKGCGGSIGINHKGNLNFADIATNHTYDRVIVISNSGTIPTKMSFHWLVVGRSNDKNEIESRIEFEEQFNFIDPRTGWARHRVLGIHFDPLEMCKANVLRPRVSPIKYWAMIRCMVVTSFEDDGVHDISCLPSSVGSSRVSPVSAEGGNEKPNKLKRLKLKSKLTPISVFLDENQRRKRIFYNLISKSPIDQHDADRTIPFITVSPSGGNMMSGGQLAIKVSLNLAHEDTFLATLICDTSILGVPPYEIPLCATPKLVSVIVSDTSKLDFGKQPIGETYTLTRTFTNVGNKDIDFRFSHGNVSLTVVPVEGILLMGEMIRICFSCTVFDDRLQEDPVVFEASCSSPIYLPVYINSGTSTILLPKNNCFDFGRCMIGKETISHLPITNQGDAMLHIHDIELTEMDGYSCGPNFPIEELCILPGETFALELGFNPDSQNPTPGLLKIFLLHEVVEVELVGTGRESVLIIDKMSLEFQDCLLGNTYTQSIEFSNVGDVNYPLEFSISGGFSDTLFEPAKAIIDPFDKVDVKVIYTPTVAVSVTKMIVASSPYSHHEVPALFHSGTAVLSLSTDVLDFGLFEKDSMKVLHFTVTNCGCVSTKYVVSSSKSTPDEERELPLKFTRSEGLLNPRSYVDIGVSYARSCLGSFEEAIRVTTDTAAEEYTITLRGTCQETLLKHSEFSDISLGMCSVMETTTRTFDIENYGGYPLSFDMKFSFPIRISPVKGVVNPYSKSSFTVYWNPSGSYELRSVIKCQTNIGVFEIVAKGRSSFPELQVTHPYVDFGICAVGIKYSKSITIQNKSKVRARWTVPMVREGYTLSTESGVLAPRDSIPLEVNFCPPSIGKYGGTFIIESKGHYKEITVVGVGGRLGFDVSPITLQLGDCPCDHVLHSQVRLTNTGDVSITVAFELSSNVQLEVMPLKPVTLAPHSRTFVVMSVIVNDVGPFSKVMRFVAREGTWSMRLRGNGIRIELSEVTKAMLESEALGSLSLPNALYPDIVYQPHKIPDKLNRRINRDLSLISVTCAEPSLDSEDIEMLQELMCSDDSDDDIAEELPKCHSKFEVTLQDHIKSCSLSSEDSASVATDHPDFDSNILELARVITSGVIASAEGSLENIPGACGSSSPFSQDMILQKSDADRHKIRRDKRDHRKRLRARIQERATLKSQTLLQDDENMSIHSLLKMLQQLELPDQPGVIAQRDEFDLFKHRVQKAIRAEHMKPSRPQVARRPVEDIAAQKVILFPYLEVRNLDLNEVLTFVEPRVHIQDTVISKILQRPAAFESSESDDRVGLHFMDSLRPIPLERKARNAPTSSFFASKTSFPLGRGVNIIAPPIKYTI